MLNTSRLTLVCAAILASEAGAQSDPQRLQVHPDRVTPNGPLLVEANGGWSTSCRGDILVNVSSTEIEIIYDRTPLEGQACPSVPFPEPVIVNPRQHFDGELQLAETVTVHLITRSSGGNDTVEATETIETVATPVDHAANFRPGLWTATAVERNVLGLERRDGSVAVMLSRMVDRVPKWQVSGGRLVGNVFTGSLVRPEWVDCDADEDCSSRRVNVAAGSINILFKGYKHALVDTRRVEATPGGVGGYLEYRPYPFGGSGVSDLAGEWFAVAEETVTDIVVGAPDQEAGVAIYPVTVEDGATDGPLPDAPVIRCTFELFSAETTWICEFTSASDTETCGPTFRYIDAGRQRVEGTLDCGSAEALPFYMFAR